MPKVGNKKFSYTKKGKAAAKSLQAASRADGERTRWRAGLHEEAD